MARCLRRWAVSPDPAAPRTNTVKPVSPQHVRKSTWTDFHCGWGCPLKLEECTTAKVCAHHPSIHPSIRPCVQRLALERPQAHEEHVAADPHAVHFRRRRHVAGSAEDRARSQRDRQRARCPRGRAKGVAPVGAAGAGAFGVSGGGAGRDGARGQGAARAAIRSGDCEGGGGGGAEGKGDAPQLRAATRNDATRAMVACTGRTAQGTRA